MVETKHLGTPIRILLGGGIGSGKSAAGRRFEQHGAKVVEADRLGHAVLEPDGEAYEPVVARWPSVVFNQRIDRASLAEIVFSDTEQLTRLEAVTHPPIIRRINELSSDARDLVIEVPLILDVPGVWTTVFVDADDNVRLRRCVDRGSDEIDVRRRMATQPSLDEWLAWADLVIGNNGAIGDFESHIDALWYRMRNTDCGLRA